MSDHVEQESGKARILIVEDEASEINLLTHRLAQRGYEICGVAETGQEAVEKTAQLKPHVALMDIRLRGRMDGIEAAHIIRERYRVPCIFVTAYDDDETLCRARVSEPYAYLLKPFTDRELYWAIEIALYKHRMEQIVHEKNSWFATTLRSIGDALIAVDPRGNVQFMNPVAENLTGWKQADALGRPVAEIFDIIHEQTRKPVDSPVHIVLRTNVSVGVSNGTILRAKDGTEIPVDSSASPIKNEGKELVGAVLIFRDVTERKRALRMIKKSEEHYRQLFEWSLAGVYKADMQGRILDCNDAFAKMLGYAERKDVIAAGDRPWLASPEDRNAFLERIRTNRSTVQEELRFMRKDGTTFWVVQNAGVLDDAEIGNVILGTVIDITDRKRMEMELREAKERAVQSDTLKTSIIANLSHEIRTPLNIILGYAGVIRTFLADRIKPEEEELFVHLEWGAKRLMRTVENVINVSKVQAGMYQFRKEILDLSAELRAIVEEMRPAATQKGLELTLNSPGPVYVSADKYAVDQAFLNLLENAVKFTQKGGVTLDISMDNATANVIVRDTGVGIAPEFLSHVFGVFLQEEKGCARAFDGLGLGLPLAKRYIEGNGGTIRIDSAKCSGTCVTVRLPLIDLAFSSQGTEGSKDSQGMFS
ncbi:MAG: PAS domain S-box protein [Bacteroidota bacterium]|nr:PAS domain S-box protein [Bacteroidota bacterium]